MKFLNREEELRRLTSLAKGQGLAVLYGRRRVGKTRLLVEWVRRTGGLYAVADLSGPDMQRRYFASALDAALPGFAEVDYPDWTAFLSRLARESKAAGWRGPFVIDEFPYLAVASPELPSVLQRFVDHDAKEAGLVVALAGSSQRMMQGLVMSREAPLFGRAREVLEIRPLAVSYLRTAFPGATAPERVRLYSAWGGIPWYWELAVGAGTDVATQVDHLVLDPNGALHHEPDRILLEEIPSALEVRPLLDAIGLGAHRVSEIGGRLARPSTSLSRPLSRLVELGLVRREVPFGELERRSKKSLYRIDDPFFRLWFRLVAPRRGLLATAPQRVRKRIFEQHEDYLASAAWEDLCRASVPRLGGPIGELGPWGVASRWWAGGAPEWDIVAESLDGRRLLLAEVKWSKEPTPKAELARLVHALVSRPPPVLGAAYADREVTRALFVPTLATGVREPKGAIVVTAADVTQG